MGKTTKQERFTFFLAGFVLLVALAKLFVLERRKFTPNY